MAQWKLAARAAEMCLPLLLAPAGCGPQSPAQECPGGATPCADAGPAGTASVDASGKDTGGGDLPAVVPLFDESTPRMPELTWERPDGTVVTRFGGRVRGRHAREDQFREYQKFNPLYFVDRTFGIEIVDTTGAGGDEITIEMTTPHPHDGDDLRAFFVGVNTVAEYRINSGFEVIDPHHYRQTLSHNPAAGRPIEAGDLVELEIGIFLEQPVEGRFNYYSRAWLYRAGEPGLIPWEGAGPNRDSRPLPDPALLGGATTLSADESDEAGLLFMQPALNVAPDTVQPFVEGRRLHHTSFVDGAHSEPGNPAFADQIGKAGPLYDQPACIACHAGNGRSMPPAETGVRIDDMVFLVGQPDGAGGFVPHASYGPQLQTRATSGDPEATVTIDRFETIAGEFDDGTGYELERPVFDLGTDQPVEHASARTAPPLVGLGLLEAVDETTVLGLAEDQAATDDGVSGRPSVVADVVTDEPRLGRFGWKAGRASLEQQIAGALRQDMGVTTSIFPGPDPEAELSDEDLELLVTYMQLLAVPPRRDTGDPQVAAGEALFDEARCATCHTPELTTGEYHPLAELRGQTIRPYTDLLLHDMGEGLAATLPGESASAREWRTPPLWGIGLTDEVAGGRARYLHDGRARTLMEAILWHAGEAEAARDSVLDMDADERAALIAFLKSL